MPKLYKIAKSNLKIFFCFLSIFCFSYFGLFAQNETTQVFTYTEAQEALRIKADDVKLIPDMEKGGYDLYIRKLPSVQSILLTETTKDPLGKNDNYAYRAKEYNTVNGNEIRLLDGKILESEYAKYSLVDSSIEYTEFFGPSFHVYIPPVMVYGYPWTRSGEVAISKGTFINIRSFEKPFADYTGNYMDNPFMFDIIQIKKEVPKPEPEIEPVEEEPEPIAAFEPPEEEEPKLPVEDVEEKIEPEFVDEELEDLVEPIIEDVPEPEPNFVEEPEPEPEFEPEPEPEPEIEPVYEDIITDDYNHIASAMLKEISNDISYSKGPETIVDDIIKVLEKGNHKENLDVVFAIDATGSMKNDINKLKADLLPALEGYFGDNSNTRIGLLFYRDYGDTFNYKNLPVKFFKFTTDFKTFARNLNSIRITGFEGGDIPEAVYEAIYAATRFYDWRPDADKQIVLIGDAEPHPTPRGTGKYSKDYVMAFADFQGVTINTILLPKD